MRDTPVRALAAEAIGTFALCFIGILAINSGDIAGNPGVNSIASVAFAHGLTIAVMVAALGHLSGAHFNPAVTAGFLATGRMDPVRGALYIVAQLLGAFLASALVGGIFGPVPVVNGTPVPAGPIPAGAATVLEAVATFFLVLVVFGTAVDQRAPKSVFPFAIGLTVALDIMAIGPLTGAAMNPARAFGPALAGGAWDNHWVYWVGPLLGGVLAALVQHHVFMVQSPSPAVATRGGPAPEEERGHL